MVRCFISDCTFFLKKLRISEKKIGRKKTNIYISRQCYNGRFARPLKIRTVYARLVDYINARVIVSLSCRLQLSWVGYSQGFYKHFFQVQDETETFVINWGKDQILQIGPDKYSKPIPKSIKTVYIKSGPGNNLFFIKTRRRCIT